jgi:hypothetical protein
VRCLNTHRIAGNIYNGFATSQDFCKLFIEDMDRLYLLSLLLTGNQDKAEQCFLESLDECLNGISVFHEWADFWARRVIIRNAVRISAPHATPIEQIPSAFDSTSQDILPLVLSQHSRFARILALEDFERFVFVLSALEGYSVQSCSILTGASRQEIVETRRRALQHIAASGTEGAASANTSVFHT